MTEEIIDIEAKNFFDKKKSKKSPLESYEQYLERLVILAYKAGFNSAANKLADNDDDTFDDMDIK